MDNLTEEQRRKTMQAVKSRGSEIEELLFKALSDKDVAPLDHHVEKLPGNPDFAHHSSKVAIFVDSCYWHGCPDHFSMPESNQEYWEQKIKGNKQRDREVTSKLEDKGWIVKRMWGHSVKDQRTRRWWATRIETLIKERAGEEE